MSKAEAFDIPHFRISAFRGGAPYPASVGSKHFRQRAS